MVGAVQRGQYPCGAVDLHEIIEIVLGSQKIAPGAMHPVIGFDTGDKDHAFFCEGRPDLKYGPVFSGKVGKKSRHVAAADMRVKQQLANRYGRNRPGL